MKLEGFVRKDGSVGIRNHILVLSTVFCVGPIAERIASSFKEAVPIRHQWCYPTHETKIVLKGLIKNPNVFGALIIGLGCEGYDENKLMKDICDLDKPKKAFNIREVGGTSNLLGEGIKVLNQMKEKQSNFEKEDFDISELKVGIKCGGSGATSGIAANPAVGQAADLLIENGATVIFSEPLEMIGTEEDLRRRAVNEEVGDKIEDIINKAIDFYRNKRSFETTECIEERMISPGNVQAGLTTITEKSIGAVSKGGSSPIKGVLKYGETPSDNGLYIMDDTGIKFSDVSTLVGFLAAGCQLTILTTDRGTVVGTPIAPVLKVCGNPDTYEKMKENMDINAGAIIQKNSSVEEMGERIFEEIIKIALGKMTKSEMHKYQEFDYVRSL